MGRDKKGSWPGEVEEQERQKGAKRAPRGVGSAWRGWVKEPEVGQAGATSGGLPWRGQGRPSPIKTSGHRGAEDRRPQMGIQKGGANAEVRYKVLSGAL